jgi:DNA-binding transcriptional LysR family regulator
MSERAGRGAARWADWRHRSRSDREGAVYVELAHLETFVAVVRHGSMTTASAELPCAVSTVSAHVAHLERRLDARLLQRGLEGCTPTPAGARVAERAVELLALHAQLLAETRAGTGGDVPRPRLPEDVPVQDG